MKVLRRECLVQMLLMMLRRESIVNHVLVKKLLMMPRRE
jgi:hypothetical protein